MSRVPRIRFKGFEEDWEQRKLGEIAERIVRKNEKLESTLPLTISAQYGLIDQNEFFDKRIASKDVRGYYLIKKGEFAYNKSTSVDAPLGAIKRLDKYNNGVLSTLYILFKIIDNTSTSSDYLVTYYSTDLWHKGIQSIAAEGARNHGLLNIAPNDFFETMLSIPLNVSEQKKVGGFFISLDHLITLHQRKLEKLKIIKKSMLENLFPQNEEKTPKIRFSGFTNDWEQRKVNEIIEDYIEKTTIQNQYTVLTSSQQKGIVYQEEYFSDRQVTTNANIGYYVLPRGYFTYRSRSDTNVFVFNRNDIIDKGIISYYYPVFFNKNSDSNFLLRRLNTGIERQIIMAAEGTGQHVLAHSKFKNMDIFVPYLDEQKRIGKYFESLDHLITLHQSKLEKLQKIKKSMLESMFV